MTSLGEYEIVEGLTKKDAIAFPTAALEEGEKTEDRRSGSDNERRRGRDYRYGC